ncbi:MAG: hypothetical protein ABFD07_08765 [Methanobacterium sp.]
MEGSQMKINLIMKILMVTWIIFSFLTPAFAESVSISSSISLSVSPATANFGTVAADGSSYSTQNSITIKSSSDVNLYVNVNDPFTSLNSIIPLKYFQYKFNNTGDFKSFSTSPLFLASLHKPSQGGADVYPIIYNLTVPVGTDVGNYTTAITYTAVTTNSLSPLSDTNTNNVPDTVINDSTANNSSNNTSYSLYVAGGLSALE